MRLIEIREREIKRYLPDDLSECDNRQYIEMCALIYAYQTGQLTYDEFRIHAIYKLLDMKPVNKGKEDIEKQSMVYQLSELIDTFFDIDKEGNKEIKQFYIQNPLPKFLGAFRNYFGPENDESFTFGEYLDTLEAFIDYNQTGEPVFLQKMLAINYRPKQPFTLNGKRMVYIPTNIDKRIDLFRSCHVGITYGFYLFFASVQKYLATAKVFVQGNEIDLALLFTSGKSKNKSELPSIGMKSILYSLSESGIYGDINAVRNTPLWEVLIRMYDITKQAADEEAAQKKATKK